MSMLFPRVWNEDYDPFLKIVEEDTDDEERETWQTSDGNTPPESQEMNLK